MQGLSFLIQTLMREVNVLEQSQRMMRLTDVVKR